MSLYRTRTIPQPEFVQGAFDGHRPATDHSGDMDPSATSSFTTAAIPALVSTGITVLYLFLKLLSYIFNATPSTPKKQEGKGTDSQERHVQQSRGARGQSAVEVHEQIEGHSHERRHGTRWATTPGTVLLSAERENLLFPTQPYGERDNEMSTLQTNDAGLCERGNTGAASRNGQGSTGTHLHTSSVPATNQRPTNPADIQSESNRRASGEEQEFATRATTDVNGPGISGFRAATATANARPIKPTVESVTQTEDAGQFLVSKETIIAYTIAVIKQTNDYHFGQMSIVYQTVHNKNALETPARAEEFARDHFNITLLTDKAPTLGNTQVYDANNTSPTTVDPTSKASTQETIPKSVEQTYASSNSRPQPTGTVPPTCRPQAELCNGIPAGYESDDSWGCYSPHANPADETPDLEEELLPLLTLQAWRRTPQRGTTRGRPRGRGRNCSHRQYTQSIPVRDGYDQPPRPWESRPYGRRTRSQRALQERAYWKWARRYQVQ